MQPRDTKLTEGTAAIGVAALALACCAGLPVLVGVVAGLAWIAFGGVAAFALATVAIITYLRRRHTGAPRRDRLNED